MYRHVRYGEKHMPGKQGSYSVDASLSGVKHICTTGDCYSLYPWCSPVFMLKVVKDLLYTVQDCSVHSFPLIHFRQYVFQLCILKENLAAYKLLQIVSVERLGLKCEFSLVSNKYIPSIWLPRNTRYM